MNIILTDCDGVLFSWRWQFEVFMWELGYKIEESHCDDYQLDKRYGLTVDETWRHIEEFNRSAYMQFLPPYLDAKKYVKKLHEEHGYVFHAITSQTSNVFAKKLREKNLERLFGPTAFERVTILGCGADKTEALTEYEGTGFYWLEDHQHNAEVGERLGLNPILFNHPHNASYDGDIPRVNNWKELYELIEG